MIMMMVMNLFPIEQSSVSNSPPKIIHFLSDDCLGSSSISVVRNRSKSILYMRMVSCFYLSRLIFNLMIKTVGFIVVKCKKKIMFQTTAIKFYMIVIWKLLNTFSYVYCYTSQ